MRIGVSRHAVALVTANRFGKARAQVVAELALGQGGVDAIGAALRQLLADAGCAKWSATVVLADELARIWQVAPPVGAARLADLEGAAALRFQSLYGESAAGWKLAGGWDTEKPFIACALPRQLLAMLGAAAGEQHVTLVEIVPQFVAGWNQYRRALLPGAWYGLVQENVLTLGAIDAGQVRAVRATALPEGAGIEWLGQHVAREALRLNLPVPQRLQLSGQAPAIWNNSSGAFACSLLAPQSNPSLSHAARLAATGICS
ncbi:hypothetical protein [Massilia sp. TSP1-1-2]|uniref:hypothetical protein n=1 Tax=Massilia sp. TSP1-1-2 TaxID=2804649 RepID=UPI003CF51845